MQAYVLINCLPGHEKEIISNLKKISEIVEINGIWGKYDIFIKVASMDPADVDKVIEKIRSINEITDTDTMHVIYGQGGTIDENPPK